MVYVAKLVTNGTQAQLTQAWMRPEKFDSLIDDPDFLGLKPGNTTYILYSTEQAALALIAREQADPNVAVFLESAEVTTLESEGLEPDEFFDVQTIVTLSHSF